MSDPNPRLRQSGSRRDRTARAEGERDRLRAENADLRAMLAKHTWPNQGMALMDEDHEFSVGYISRCVECGGSREIFYDEDPGPGMHNPGCRITELLETKPK